jgi:hypothetical protein
MNKKYLCVSSQASIAYLKNTVLLCYVWNCLLQMKGRAGIQLVFDLSELHLIHDKNLLMRNSSLTVQISPFDCLKVWFPISNI